MNNFKPVTIKPQFDKNGKVNLPTGTYLKAIRNIDNNKHKDSFAFLFSEFYVPLRNLHTITSYRTFFALALLTIERGGYELKVTQKELSEFIGCAGAEISKAIANLEEVGLIITHSRGIIVMNPRYIWRGSLATWQEAVEESNNKYIDKVGI